MGRAWTNSDQETRMDERTRALQGVDREEGRRTTRETREPSRSRHAGRSSDEDRPDQADFSPLSIVRE